MHEQPTLACLILKFRSLHALLDEEVGLRKTVSVSIMKPKKSLRISVVPHWSWTIAAVMSAACSRKSRARRRKYENVP